MGAAWPLLALELFSLAWGRVEVSRGRACVRDRPIFESQHFSALWSWAKLVTSAGLISLMYKIRIFIFCGSNEYYKSVKILV